MSTSTITDVTDDPTVVERAHISAALLAEAHELGFELAGWFAVTSSGSTLLSAVLVHEGGGMLLELSRVFGMDDVLVKTLLEDGTVVYTNKKPSLLFWSLFRWGLVYPKRHRIESEFFRVRSLAELVVIHEKRVAGRPPLSPHDLRTHVAMRARAREISEPRMARQESVAKKLAVVSAVVAALCSIGAAWDSGTALATVVAALAAAATAGVAGFAISLVFFAPLLVRGTPAPAPRPASELLLLAADVPRGPIPDTLGKAHLASAPAPAPAENGRIAVDVVPAALVRLKRIDLAAAIANAMVLPVAGALAIARLGPPGIWVAGGLVLTVDALVRLATKRSRAEIVRTVAVPALVRAEVCTTGTCGLASPQATWLMLVFGVACIAAARHEIIQSELASPAWVVFQWFTLTSVLLVWTVSRVRARHERLACVNVTAR